MDGGPSMVGGDERLPMSPWMPCMTLASYTKSPMGMSCLAVAATVPSSLTHTCTAVWASCTSRARARAGGGGEGEEAAARDCVGWSIGGDPTAMIIIWFAPRLAGRKALQAKCSETILAQNCCQTSSEACLSANCQNLLELVCTPWPQTRRWSPRSFRLRKYFQK